MKVDRNNRKTAVLVLLSDGKWHRTAEIQAVSVGGSEGTRRLRELRKDGFRIEKRRCEGSTQFEYRLTGKPAPVQVNLF